MAKKVVSLGDLKALSDQYLAQLKKVKDPKKVKKDGTVGDAVDAAKLKAVTDALMTISTTAEEVCEQPVLAIIGDDN